MLSAIEATFALGLAEQSSDSREPIFSSSKKAVLLVAHWSQSKRGIRKLQDVTVAYTFCLGLVKI